MFWSLSVVSMWQTQHQSRSLLPFRLSRSQKLINNTLCVLLISLATRVGVTFAKSPNCISHMTNASGELKLYPYSNPKTPYSLNELLQITNVPSFSPGTCINGTYVFSVF